MSDTRDQEFSFRELFFTRSHGCVRRCPDKLRDFCGVLSYKKLKRGINQAKAVTENRKSDKRYRKVWERHFRTTQEHCVYQTTNIFGEEVYTMKKGL